jgi:hypothetical protein
VEGELDPAYVSALAALAGALIGGLTSFITSWLTQRTQLRFAQRQAESAELKALYADFIAEAARLFVDALGRDSEDFTDLVKLYAMGEHMRLVSDQRVVDAAQRVETVILDTYMGQNRTAHELMDFAKQGGFNFLAEFSQACRNDLAARATAVR